MLASVVFLVTEKKRPLTTECDLDLQCGNQCLEHGISSHDALSFCEV